MRRRFLLVENPVAGTRHRRLVEQTVRQLERRGAAVERRVTQYAGQMSELAAQAARADRYDALIAAGGDGTVREAVKGLLGTTLALGIIPCGTGNVLSYELRLPRRADQLAAYLCQGPQHAVHPGIANGEAFLLMCGIGLDADIVGKLDPNLKRRLGKAAYAMPILAGLCGAPRPGLRLKGETATTSTDWAVIAKSGRYGGPFRLTAKAGLFAGGLQLVTITSQSNTGRAARLASLALGILDRMPGVAVRPCTRLEVSCDTPVMVQVDGDIIGTTPVMIDQAQETISLIAPQ